MLPTALLTAFLAISILASGLDALSRAVDAVDVSTAALAASPAPASNTDDWASRALADPEMDRGWDQPCKDDWNDGRDVYCVVKEFPYTADAKPIAIDGGENGGIEVMGWDKSTVRVLYRVKARARGEDRAREIAEAIEVTRTGGKVRPEGPETNSREWWSAEFKVWVPRSSDLWLHTLNGPLGITRVRGTMDLRTTNGPLSLVDLGGAVQARADNGPLHVELEGARWQGAGLDASTQNGPVDFELPANYSALIETGTINGPKTIDYELHLRRLGHGHINTTLGSGGPPVRVVTDNGPFRMASR